MSSIHLLRLQLLYTRSISRSTCAYYLFCIFSLSIGFHSSTLAAELEQLLPSSSSNAALHYQRGILFLADVAPAKRKLLEKPIWEIVSSQMTEQETEDINTLLVSSRHAIRAAIIGAAQANADFGADMRAYAAGTLLPHVGPMQHLAKMVALYGLQEQGEGDWEKSAQLYLDVVRMGQHMGEQLTLAESVEGVRILETGYHSLVAWAVHCPDPKLIKQVRSLLGAIAPHPLSPSTALGYEAALVDIRLAQLQNAYPNGNWAEMMLTVIEGQPDKLDQASLESYVQAAVVKRGVPKTIFESNDSFDAFLEKLRTVNAEYYDRMLDCIGLPPEKSVAEGQRIYQEFAPKLLRLGDPNTLNPSQIAAYYASHEAEHKLAGVVLALCANKQGELFPKDLSSVKDSFGGDLPASPLGAGKISYQPTADQKGFRISYPGTKIGDVEIPAIAFDYGGGK